MTVLEIVDWDEHFENEETREMDVVPFALMPNKMDGDGYTELMLHDEAARIFGTWLHIVEITGKCIPRGLLLRSGLRPHDVASLARQSRGKKKDFELAIPVLLDLGWLRYNTIEEHEKR
ncbi:unnamed protein product, partial [marine sediment metagenome]